MADDESGKSEAEVKMLEARKKQAEKEQDELREYEEQRRSEREKEQEDIQRLKERREQRRKEREEEERRMSEMRQVEEQRRRQEEEERLRKKREDEAKKREAILHKQQEMMRYDTQAGKPNYVITKKQGDGQGNAHDQDDGNGLDVVAKSKEQLEAEKKAALAQRVQPLNIDGLSLEQLLEKAKDLYQQLHRLESDKYDLDQRFKKQQGDLLELAERARQMNKGGGKKQNQVKQESDAIADKYGAPTMIQMYSPYERVKDRRTFVDRRELYTGPQFAPPVARIEPNPENVSHPPAEKENAAPAE